MCCCIDKTDNCVIIVKSDVMSNSCPQRNGDVTGDVENVTGAATINRLITDQMIFKMVFTDFTSFLLIYFPAYTLI